MAQENQGFQKKLHELLNAREKMLEADKHFNRVERAMDRFLADRYRAFYDKFKPLEERGKHLGYKIPEVILDTDGGFWTIPFFADCRVRDIERLATEGFIRFNIEDSRFYIPEKYLDEDGIEKMDADVQRIGEEFKLLEGEK